MTHHAARAAANDVWLYAHDAGTWTSVTTSAPWAARRKAELLARGDSVVLLGGETFDAEAEEWVPADDVWVSANQGRDWTLCTSSPPWAGRRAPDFTIPSDYELGHVRDAAYLVHAAVLDDGTIVAVASGLDDGQGPAVPFALWTSSMGNCGSWTSVSATGIATSLRVHSVVQAGSALVMAGTDGSGALSDPPAPARAWRSTDSGATWTQVGTFGSFPPRFQPLVRLHALESDAVLAVVDFQASFYLLTADPEWHSNLVTFRSANGGATWAPRTAFLSPRRLAAAQAVFANERVLLLGGLDFGFNSDAWLWVQERGWEQVAGPIALGLSNPALLVPAANGSLLLPYSPGSVYLYSHDGGNSWDSWPASTPSADLAQQLNSANLALSMPDGDVVVQTEHEGETLFLGTEDWGASWHNLSTLPATNLTTLLRHDGSLVTLGGEHPGVPGRIFSADSTDGARSWRHHTGATPAAVQPVQEACAAVLEDDTVLVAGGLVAGQRSSQVWRLEPNDEWVVVRTRAQWPPRTGAAMAVLPTGAVVLMGGEGDGWALLDDVWVSTTAGAVWRLLGRASAVKRSNGRVLTLSDGSLLLAGGLVGYTPGRYLPIFSGAIWRSVSGGLQWQEAKGVTGSGARSHAAAVVTRTNVVVMGGMGSMGPLADVRAARLDAEPLAFSTATRLAEFGARAGAAASFLPSTGAIVLTGGADESGVPLGDVWSSSDEGRSWVELDDWAPWPDRAYHAMVLQEEDAELVLLGGRAGGEALHDVWISDDGGRSWWEVAAQAAWEARSEMAVAVLPDGRLVLAGGVTAAARLLNDVWLSDESAAHWMLVASSAPWAPRAGHSMVLLAGGSLLLAGGQAQATERPLRRDAYVSLDGGSSWTLATSNARWAPRAGHAALALPDGRMVVLGGDTGAAYRSDEQWVHCPVGSRLQAGACQLCEEGHTSDTVTCSACTVGTYADEAGVCVPCEEGHFQGAEGAEECQPCGADELCPFMTAVPLPGRARLLAGQRVLEDESIVLNLGVDAALPEKYNPNDTIGYFITLAIFVPCFLLVPIAVTCVAWRSRSKLQGNSSRLLRLLRGLDSFAKMSLLADSEFKGPEQRKTAWGGMMKVLYLLALLGLLAVLLVGFRHNNGRVTFAYHNNAPPADLLNIMPRVSFNLRFAGSDAENAVCALCTVRTCDRENRGVTEWEWAEEGEDGLGRVSLEDVEMPAQFTLYCALSGTMPPWADDATKAPNVVTGLEWSLGMRTPVGQSTLRGSLVGHNGTRLAGRVDLDTVRTVGVEFRNELAGTADYGYDFMLAGVPGVGSPVTDVPWRVPASANAPEWQLSFKVAITTFPGRRELRVVPKDTVLTLLASLAALAGTMGGVFAMLAVDVRKKLHAKGMLPDSVAKGGDAPSKIHVAPAQTAGREEQRADHK